MDSVANGIYVQKLLGRIKNYFNGQKGKSIILVDDSCTPSHRHGYSSKAENLYNTTNSSLVCGSSVYQFSRPKMGYVIMIINSTFDLQKYKISDRKTAYLDCDNMANLFEALGFETKKIENKTNDEFWKSLSEIRNSIGKDHDFMACIISSHGAQIPLSDSKLIQHVIYTRDAFVPTDEILTFFDDDHCENLIGKPKMFFIQACRCELGGDEKLDVDAGFDVEVGYRTSPKGKSHLNNTYVDSVSYLLNQVTSSVPNTHGRQRTEYPTNNSNKLTQSKGKERLQNDQTYSRTANGQERDKISKFSASTHPEEVCLIPCEEDFLVMFTSSSGRLGWSDKSKGGWLMHCLYKVFENLLRTNYEEDLLQILSNVCGKMAHDLESYCVNKVNYHRTKSAAVVYHRLTKELYLRPKFHRMVEKQNGIIDTEI